MDRDYKIGIIAGFIVIVAVLLMAENSEYKQCLQAGAESFSYESYATASNKDAQYIFRTCSKKSN
mgnify:CR=1 FL=1